jgi:N-acetyl-gamma-glutamyl-phosphate reductase
MGIKIGIIGGAGYTGGELLRILLHHPQAEICYVHSESHFDHKVYDVHCDLLGETEMTFTKEVDIDVNVLFLCTGHGKSLDFLNKYTILEHTRLIDLSQDFRVQGKFISSLGVEREFVYGLPEFWSQAIRGARSIANPGCFATAIELALLPLAGSHQIQSDVHIHGITGSTGAGQGLSETSHYSWRNNNVSVYKAFNHQHMKEVRNTLESASNDRLPTLNFIPVRGNFTRGIFLTAYTACKLELDEIITLYKDFYKNAAFTFVAEHEISLKDVVNTNKCFLHLEKHDGNVFITSVIDNLTKGASGQAVQNMNLMFGFNEKTGLNLKSVNF